MDAQNFYNFLLGTRDVLQNQLDDIDDALDTIRTGGNVSSRGYSDVTGEYRGGRGGAFTVPSSRRGRMSGGYSRYDEGSDIGIIGDIRTFDQHIGNVVSHSLRSTLREFGITRGNVSGGGGNSGGSGTDLTDDQLTEMLNSAKRNPSDNSLIDTSTNEGRELVASGWADRDGHILVEFEEETVGRGGKGGKQPSRSRG